MRNTKSVWVFSIAISLTSLFFRAQAQEFSHINLNVGANFYKFGQIGEINSEGSYCYSDGLKWGVGVNYRLLDYIRIEYNVLFFRENLRLFYDLENANYRGQINEIKNNVWQNQFILILANYKNKLNLRAGFTYDLVIHSSTNITEDQPLPDLEEKSYILTGPGDRFVYHQLSSLFGLSAALFRNTLLTFDFIAGINPRYYTGESNMPYLKGDFGVGRQKHRYLWTITFTHFLFQKWDKHRLQPLKKSNHSEQ